MRILNRLYFNMKYYLYNNDLSKIKLINLKVFAK